MSAGSALVLPHLRSPLNDCHPRPVIAYAIQNDKKLSNIL
jgi:hypothetical protein